MIKQRWVRVTVKALAGLVLVLATVWAVWALFNSRWTDAPPQPQPEALRMLPPTLAPERNAMFAVMALKAPAGLDPQAEGQRRWQLIEDAQPTAARAAYAEPSLQWPMDAASAPAAVKDEWRCHAEERDCVAAWSAQAEALSGLVAQAGLIGQRCEALAQPGVRMEEPLSTPRARLETAADRFLIRDRIGTAAAVDCQRWMHLRAVLASRSGDLDTMLQRLDRSEALTSAMLEGARSLPGALIAGAMARRHWAVVTGLAARHPALSSRLAQRLKPLPTAALDSRWIRAEASFNREALREIGCGVVPPGAAPEATPAHCERPAWFQINATQQLMDARWLEALTFARGGPLKLLEWNTQRDPDWALGFPFRNSTGEVIAAVAFPGYDLYVRQQASLLLLNEAARLALAAHAVAPEERAAWLARQPIDARLLDRLRIDGDAVVARIWATPRYPEPQRYPIPPDARRAGRSTGSDPGPSTSRS